VVLPEDDDPHRRLVLGRLNEGAAAGLRVVVVARPETLLPSRVGAIHDIVRLADDVAQARLLDAVLTPGPFRAIIAPGVNAPTGVAVWMESHVIVGCDDSGLVVSVDAVTGRSTTLMPGLVEPHGLWLDRRHLLIAAKGSNRIHVGELLDGRFHPHQDLATGPSLPLLSPHFAMQAVDRVFVVDTDHHRVLEASGSVLHRVGKFETVHVETKLHHPCGLALWGSLLAVADTMGDRVILLRKGLVVATLESPAPVQVAVTPDQLLAIVSTDGLRLVRVDRRGSKFTLSVLRHDPAGGANPLRTPFGVAVDRSGRVFVADRGRGVVWAALVSELLAEVTPDVA
jgi:hypothetical protein